MKTYHEFLEGELNNFEGNFDKYILHTPNLFKLLCKIHDENIDLIDKKDIDTALSYFVLPNDLISEEMYGPAGYIDDIFVTSLVLKKIQKKYGNKVIEKNWDFDEEPVEVIDTCYKKSKKELENQKLLEKIIKITGLRDINE